MTVAQATPTTTASVPWGCWYGDTRFDLSFPPGFHVDVLDMHDALPLGEVGIRAAVEQPTGTSRLKLLAAGARSAVIAVDDISRPTPAADVLPAVLRELADIPQDRVSILIALGAHRPMVRHELEMKLGADVLSGYDVQQHHPYENLVDAPRSSRGTPVRLNRTFVEADLRIGISSVVPHPYMGFGGGAKIVVPGLAGIETLQANHQPAVTGISGGLCDPEVEARRDIEEIALAAGLAFTCNAVVNSRRQIAGLFCGHPVASHREAARFCRTVYATKVNAAPYDVLCLNSYPKRHELLPAGHAMKRVRSAGRPALTSSGHGSHHDVLPDRAPGFTRFPGRAWRFILPPGGNPFLRGP